MPTMYEPRYYERAAQRQVARDFGLPVFVNVPWGLDGTPATRHELDALFFVDRRAVAVEVKAHVVDDRDVADIAAKYASLGFGRLVVVAPGLSGVADRGLARGALSVDLVVYRPEVDEIRDWYASQWPAAVPAWVNDTLATGRHHLRFVLSRPTERGRFVIGQQRARVYDTATISRLLGRLPSPPVRVLWTPQRFTIPRDLIARKSQVTPLGGFVAVDVDGDRLHRARHACELPAPEFTCVYCDRYARRELDELTDRIGDTPLAVVASGGRGVHAYYEDRGGIRSRILELARSGAVRIDENVTASLKATVALPGSLHASNMRPVTSVVTDVSERDRMAAACL